MYATLAFIAVIAAVAARIYFGRLAAQTFDALPPSERERITTAMSVGRY